MLKTGLLGLLLALCAVANAGEKLRVYIGTYTGQKPEDSKGIYLSELDLTTGALTAPKLVAETPNPTFLNLHTSGKYLYAASEIGNFNGGKTGAVAGFTIDAASGALTALNAQPSGGGGTCHVNVDPSGKFALGANYGGGSICAHPIGADGKLGEQSGFVQHAGSSVNPGRQKGPHAHSINTDPSGTYVYAADLGLDKVLIYKLDGGKLTPNDPPHVATEPGGGPRHFAFHPNGNFAYCNLELTSKVTAFAFDKANGALTAIHTLSTLPEEVKGNSTAEIVAHPSGKFVYVSNRGHNSIAIFTCDPATGKLTAAGHASTQGKTPRNFNVTPDGAYLLAANQDSRSVFVFKIDPATGALTSTGTSIEVAKPVRVLFAKMN